MRSPLTTVFGLAAGSALLLSLVRPLSAQVKPGDFITRENAASVTDLLSPGNLILVKQGMTMRIVPAQHLEWPTPYKLATEKYSSQVILSPEGALRNYIAGLPFPLLDPNDPQVAQKIMWNFSFRPLYTDDVDIRDLEAEGRAPSSTPTNAVENFATGHFAFYNNIDRTEVAPTPTDPDATKSGIRYRFATYPILEPSEIRGLGFLRYRYEDPGTADNAWVYNSFTRRTRRISEDAMSDALGTVSDDLATSSSTYANTLDPDSYFGFAAKVEDYDYKLLGVKPMLACVAAVNSPARPCVADNGRTVCEENWEMRQLYVVQASAKRTPLLGSGPTIPRRVLYIDSEAWLITASDQYDRSGQLWKTIAILNAYRDRPTPAAKLSVWPFKRIFQSALVDADVQSGISTVLYTPSRDDDFSDPWSINQGVISPTILVPGEIMRLGH